MSSSHSVNETKTTSTEIVTKVCQNPACINSVIVKRISVSFRTKATEIAYSLKIRASQRMCWICVTPKKCSPQWHSRNLPQLKLPSWTGVLCQSRCPAQLLSPLSLLLCSLQHEYLGSISHSVEKKKKKKRNLLSIYGFNFFAEILHSLIVSLWSEKGLQTLFVSNSHTKAIFSNNSCIWQDQSM